MSQIRACVSSFVLLVVMLALPVLARAQCPAQPAFPVIGPHNLCFPMNPDHNNTFLGQPIVAGYKVTMTPTAGTPITVDLQKPTPVNGVINLPNWTGYSTLAANTSYTMIVQAYGPGGATGQPPVGPFGNPGPPSVQGVPVISQLLSAPGLMRPEPIPSRLTVAGL